MKKGSVYCSQLCLYHDVYSLMSFLLSSEMKKGASKRTNHPARLGRVGYDPLPLSPSCFELHALNSPNHREILCDSFCVWATRII